MSFLCRASWQKKTVQKAWVFVPHHLAESKSSKSVSFCAAPFGKKTTVQNAWVFCAAPFGSKKKFKKCEFECFVPHNLAEPKMVQKAWFFCAAPFSKIENGSKSFSVSFLCRTISQKKKWFKKCEFFVPHHLAKTNQFKKHEFFVPHHLGEKKWFKKCEFFMQRHLPPPSDGLKTLIFSNCSQVGLKLSKKWFIECTLPCHHI